VANNSVENPDSELTEKEIFALLKASSAQAFVPSERSLQAGSKFCKQTFEQIADKAYTEQDNTHNEAVAYQEQEFVESGITLDAQNTELSVISDNEENIDISDVLDSELENSAQKTENKIEEISQSAPKDDHLVEGLNNKIQKLEEEIELLSSGAVKQERIIRSLEKICEGLPAISLEYKEQFNIDVLDFLHEMISERVGYEIKIEPGKFQKKILTRLKQFHKRSEEVTIEVNVDDFDELSEIFNDLTLKTGVKFVACDSLGHGDFVLSDSSLRIEDKLVKPQSDATKV
jgi:flagellar biosynthesis/type III secretory pathway protein FliH